MDTLDIGIRQLRDTPQDLRKLRNFLQEIDASFPVPLSDKTDLDQMAEKVLRLGTVFAAEQREEVAGVVTGYANDRESRSGYIAVAGVSQHYQNRRIGKRLVQAFASHAFTQGMERVTLLTHQDNAGAIRFYQQLGFVVDATLKKNYSYDVALRLDK